MKEWQAELAERDLEGLGDILRIHGWEVLPPFYRIAMSDDGPFKYPLTVKPSTNWVGRGKPNLADLEWVKIYQTDPYVSQHERLAICQIFRKDMGTGSFGPELVFPGNDIRVTEKVHIKAKYDPTTTFFEADVRADKPSDTICILKLEAKYAGTAEAIEYSIYTAPNFGFFHVTNGGIVSGSLNDNSAFDKPEPPPYVDLDNVSVFPATFAIARHQLFRHPSGQLYGLATVRKHEFSKDYIKQVAGGFNLNPVDKDGNPIYMNSPKGVARFRDALRPFASFAIDADNNHKSMYGCPQYYTYMLDDFNISDSIGNATCALSSTMHMIPCKSVDLVRAALDLTVYYDVFPDNHLLLPIELVMQDASLDDHWYTDLVGAKLFEELNQLDGNTAQEEYFRDTFKNILNGDEGHDHDSGDHGTIPEELHPLFFSAAADELAHLTKNPLWKAYPSFKQSPIVPLMLRHSEGAVPHPEDLIIPITEDDRNKTKCVQDFKVVVTVQHPKDGVEPWDIECTAEELATGKPFSLSSINGTLSLLIKGTVETVDGFGALKVSVSNTGNETFSVTNVRAVASVRNTVNGAVSIEQETYAEPCYEMCLPKTEHSFPLDMSLSMCAHEIPPEPVDPEDPPKPDSPDTPPPQEPDRECVDTITNIRIKMVPSTFPSGIEYLLTGSLDAFMRGKTFRTRDGLYTGKITLRLEDDGSSEAKLIATLENTTTGQPYMSGGKLVLWEVWAEYKIKKVEGGKTTYTENERASVSMTVVEPGSSGDHPPIRLPFGMCQVVTPPAEDSGDSPVSQGSCWDVVRVFVQDNRDLKTYTGKLGQTIKFNGCSAVVRMVGTKLHYKLRFDKSVSPLPNLGVNVSVYDSVAGKSELKPLTVSRFMAGCSVDSSGYSEFYIDMNQYFGFGKCTASANFQLYNMGGGEECTSCALEPLATVQDIPTKVQQKTKRMPRPAKRVESNWWASQELAQDSTVQVRGYVSSRNLFFVLRADTAPHWQQPHFVPNSTLFWGQVTPAFDTGNGIWKGWKGHNALFGSTSQKTLKHFSPTSRKMKFRKMLNMTDSEESRRKLAKDFIDNEVKGTLYTEEVNYAPQIPSVLYPCFTYEVSADRSFSPMLKNYNHNPAYGDGLHDIILREDTYHNEYQSHSLSWNVPVNALPLSEHESVAEYDDGLEYERTGGRIDKEAYAYHVNPSKYSDLIEASAIKVIHNHYGEVGWFEGVLAAQPYTMVSDDELDSNHNEQCGFRVDLNYQNVTSVFSPLTFPKDSTPYPCVEIKRPKKKVPARHLEPPPLPPKTEPSTEPSGDPGGINAGLKILFRWEDATRTRSIYPWGAMLGVLYLQLANGNIQKVPMVASGYKSDTEGYQVICNPAYPGSIQEHDEILKGFTRKSGILVGAPVDMEDEYLKSYHDDLPNEFVLNLFGDRVKKVGIVVYRYPKLPYSMGEAYNSGNLPAKSQLTQPVQVDVVADTHGYPKWLSTRHYGKPDCTLLKRWVIEPDNLNNIGGKASGKSAVFVGTIEGSSNKGVTFTDSLTPIGNLDYLSTYKFLGW